MNADTVTFDTEECEQFIQLWMELTEAPHVTLVSIVPDRQTMTCTFERGDLEAAKSWIAEQQKNGSNVYFQPNETHPGCAKKPSKQDMTAALCRFADIDPLDDQLPFADERARLEQLATHLGADPNFPPTAIIDSGNGMQPIWAVSREQLSPSSVTRIEGETKALENALGAGGTHNIDRLLRLPGTINFPNARKRALGRSVSRARLIHCGANVYTVAQAATLPAHLAAYFSATDFVRLRPQKSDGQTAAGVGDRKLAALVAELLALGAAGISQADHLPAGLFGRLQRALKARKRLADRWAGLVDDLSEAGRDSSCSGVDMSLAGMLKAASFTAVETALILCAFPHGKTNGEDWPSASTRLRHAARCALRSSDRGAESGHEVDPDRPPAFTDEALALHFTDLHKHRLRYVAAWGRWLFREPDVWRFDDTLLALDLARSVCRQSAAACGNPRIALVIASAKTVFAVERLAKADRVHAATVEQWDADPWLLNTPAGVVDLRTGDMRPHHPDDYFTKITAVAPGGDCPTWHRFLNRITSGNMELQAFLQRVAGYSLTGNTREHALFFGFGTGANGKGTFINTLTGILGGYAAIAVMETFTASQGERHPTDLAMLRGARLVTAQETEEGRRWAESRVKALTGGDPISARFMRQDFFTFIPQFKLFIIGNHRPGLRNVDEAIRRRFHLVPFEVQIPPADRDHDLPEKLRTEWPGILQWMIDGSLGWQAEGLAAPEAVRTATDDYLQAEDALALWIDERCKKTDWGYTEATRLYDDWRRWAIAAGEEPGSQKRFSEALQARGYAKVRTNIGRMAFEGIALNDVRPAYSEPEHERY
jgi:putative DNA primase/helicase